MKTNEAKGQGASSYEAEIKERVAKAVRNCAADEDKLQLAQLEEWAKERKPVTTFPLKKLTMVMVCLLCIGGIVLTLRYFTSTSPVAEAGKNQTSHSQSGEDAVIKNNSQGTDANAGRQEEVHTTWEGVLTASETYPELLIPGYVPKGYTFKSLTIIKSKDFMDSMYSYTNETSMVLEINIVSPVDSTVAKDYDRIISSTNTGIKIYINEDSGIIQGIGVLSNNSISVLGNVSDEEIISIIDKLKVEGN